MPQPRSRPRRADAVSLCHISKEASVKKKKKKKMCLQHIQHEPTITERIVVITDAPHQENVSRACHHRPTVAQKQPHAPSVTSIDEIFAAHYFVRRAECTPRPAPSRSSLPSVSAASFRRATPPFLRLSSSSSRRPTMSAGGAHEYERLRADIMRRQPQASAQIRTQDEHDGCMKGPLPAFSLRFTAACRDRPRHAPRHMNLRLSQSFRVCRFSRLPLLSAAVRFRRQFVAIERRGILTIARRVADAFRANVWSRVDADTVDAHIAIPGIRCPQNVRMFRRYRYSTVSERQPLTAATLTKR